MPFHGMGTIACSTPAASVKMIISRKRVNAHDIAEVNRIKIHISDEFLSSDRIMYSDFKSQDSLDYHINMLWHCSLLFGKPAPTWSGFMQMVHKGPHPGKASVSFMPMIDRDPSDPTCILSTLIFVHGNASKNGITPVLTFDLPLYWKSFLIIQNTTKHTYLKDIVLRLGPFHAEMSFAGVLGHNMDGSGLEAAIELLYASPDHILSGKAISRTVRFHILSLAVLRVLILMDCFELKGNPFSTDEDEKTEYLNNLKSSECFLLICQLEKDMEKVVNQEMHPNDVNDLPAMSKVVDLMNVKCAELKAHRTSKLWLQHMESVMLLQHFIMAERLGMWELHLACLRKMLPLFASSGHNLYCKVASVYLDEMDQLPSKHPDVYSLFLQGHHVIRRSDREWGGVSSDLAIEQLLMRSVKSSGGLTRGTGMTENCRTIWVLSRPICSMVHNAMQELTGVEHRTSEQNRGMSPSKISRDWHDMNVLYRFFRERNPFDVEGELMNISTGIRAFDNVNVDDAFAVGEHILQDMSGKSVSQHTFKKNTRQ